MAGRRKRRLRILLLLGVASLAVSIACLAHFGGVLDEPELDTVDARFELRGTQDPPREVVVVKIDDVTFGDLRERFPFPRSLHAKAVDRLRGYGAKTIAYDVQFTEPTEPSEDEALIDSLRRAGNAVLVTTEVDDRGRSAVLGGRETMEFAKVRDSDATLRPDKGGVFRRFPYSPQGLDGFAVAVVERATGRKVDEDEFEDDGEQWIDFAGPPATVSAVSFSRLVNGRVDPREIRGKIAVVGASAPSLQDVRPTSTSGDELMSGAEIQANAISTVLRGFPLKSVPAPVEGLLIVILGLAGPLLGLRARPLSGVALGVAIGAAYAGLAYLLFRSGTIVPVVAPLLALAIGGVGALAVHYSMAALDREYVRLLFSRFVPEDVVNQLVKDEELRLGGVAADSTVLFSDIRGFTSFSEGRDPELVLSVLNEYHGHMCEAIYGNGGTLISYIGDGIMAAFGVPIAQDDHADRALSAAREMVGEHLKAFNEWMVEQGFGEFQMGVGLNSGEVTAGNIGSEIRLEYTAIGDTVNTASRLESMTKGTPHQIFVADTTRKRLSEIPGDLVLVDDLEVRGRLSKVKVWGVL